MPVEWLGGFSRRYVTNRVTPRRRQLGRPHNRTVDKIVLHTTEGSTASGAFGAYDSRAGLFSGGVHPHVTVDPFRRLRYQHVPLTRASYSLKRGDADGVIQVEIVGWADHDWTGAQLDWLGAHVLAPIIEAVPTIPAIAPAEFLPASAGMLALPWPRGRARLSPAQWDRAVGVLGHQHAPYDDHWDPGGIDIARILTAADVTPPPTIAHVLSEVTHMQYCKDNDGDIWLIGDGWHRNVGDAAPTGAVVFPISGLKYVLADLEAAGVSVDVTNARKN